MEKTVMASELIACLQTATEQYGDVPVMIRVFDHNDRFALRDETVSCTNVEVCYTLNLETGEEKKAVLTCHINQL